MLHPPFCALPSVRLQVVCILLSAMGFFLMVPSVYAAVVINEIYPKEEGNEWIELYNNGSESVSLDRWSLESTTGEKKKFTFNASANISPNGFLTVSQSETGIVLANEGDGVRLTDSNNSQVDNQSFPSILGYNSSAGRSTDGGGTWAVCIVGTKDKPNNCPAPTPAPTVPATPVPTNTLIPTAIPTVIPTTTSLPLPTEIPVLSPQVLGTTGIPTSIPTPQLGELRQSENLRSAGWVILGLGIVWGIIVLIAVVHHKFKQRNQ